MPEITITAKRDGFRRCGVSHSGTPVTWPDGTFTEAEIAILRAEPMLVVYDGQSVPAIDTAEKLGQLSSENTTLKEQVGTLTTENTDLTARVNALTTDNATLQTQVDTLTTDKAALQAQIDQLSAGTKGNSK